MSFFNDLIRKKILDELSQVKKTEMIDKATVERVLSERCKGVDWEWVEGVVGTQMFSFFWENDYK